MIGSKDESAVITHIKDNLFNLKLNINHKAEKITDKYFNINFIVNYKVNNLKQIIVNNQSKNKELWQALTYKLIKQRTKHNINKYVVSINFDIDYNSVWESRHVGVVIELVKLLRNKD